MSVTTTTHLNFRGQAREALDFYAAVFGGQVMAFTYADAHDEVSAEQPDHLKWGGIVAPNGFAIMAYDVQAGRPLSRGDDPIFVSVRGSDPDEITRFFTALATDGEIKDALGPAGFSPLYGKVTDRFGITWVMDVQPAG